MADMARVLDLTAAQQQQIEAILAATREANRPIREKLRQNKQALRAAAKADPVDREEIRSLTTAGGNLKADLLLSRIAIRKQIEAVLTPEQREMKEKIRPLLKHRFGKRHMHHRGPGPYEPADS